MLSLVKDSGPFVPSGAGIILAPDAILSIPNVDALPAGSDNLADLNCLI
jgi:hypothetical protein